MFIKTGRLGKQYIILENFSNSSGSSIVTEHALYSEILNLLVLKYKRYCVLLQAQFGIAWPFLL